MSTKIDEPLSPSSRQPIASVMNLRKQLRYYLERHDMTLSQLARKANVPKQSISGWMVGSKPRDVTQVKRVAHILGTSMDNLFFGEGHESQRLSAFRLEEAFGDGWVEGVFEVRLRRIRNK